MRRNPFRSQIQVQTRVLFQMNLKGHGQHAFLNYCSYSQSSGKSVVTTTLGLHLPACAAIPHFYGFVEGGWRHQSGVSRELHVIDKLLVSCQSCWKQKWYIATYEPGNKNTVAGDARNFNKAVICASVHVVPTNMGMTCLLTSKNSHYTAVAYFELLLHHFLEGHKSSIITDGPLVKSGTQDFMGTKGKC
jgi:hypothetical protein